MTGVVAGGGEGSGEASRAGRGTGRAGRAGRRGRGGAGGARQPRLGMQGADLSASADVTRIRPPPRPGLPPSNALPAILPAAAAACLACRRRLVARPPPGASAAAVRSCAPPSRHCDRGRCPRPPSSPRPARSLRRNAPHRLFSCPGPSPRRDAWVSVVRSCRGAWPCPPRPSCVRRAQPVHSRTRGSYGMSSRFKQTRRRHPQP